MEIRVHGYELGKALNKFKHLTYKLDKNNKNLQNSLQIITGSNSAKLIVCNGASDEYFEIIEMSQVLSCEVIEPGQVLIPHDLLPVMASIDRVVTITNNIISYDGGNIIYNPVEHDFININVECTHDLFGISEKELYRVLKNTSYAMQKCEGRPILNGVNFKNNKVVALDGYRLALTEWEFRTDIPITLPSNLVNLLLKVLNKKSDKKIVFQTDDKVENIVIKLDNLTLSSELLKGDYIKYESLLPNTCRLKIRVNGKQLLDKFKKIFKLRSSTQEIGKFEIDEDKLTLINYNSKMSLKEIVSIEILECDLELPFEIAFNPFYWKDVLKKHNEEIEIEFYTHVSPIVVKSDNDLDLVLPVRVQRS